MVPAAAHRPRAEVAVKNSGGAAPDVSVVVPVHNAGRFIEPLLQSLAEQQTSTSWELIAVDNRSTDDSRARIERFPMPVPTRVVDAPHRPSPAYARNTGAAVARGHKLLFIDADDEVDRGYVDAMSRALDDHDFVTPRVDSTSLNAEWVRAAHGPPWQEDGLWVAFDFLPASGSNAGVRKAHFDRIGGYPEGFVYSDDVAFSWNAHLAGARLHFVREAVYRYRYRDSLPALYRQGVTWGDGVTALYSHYHSKGMPGRSMRMALDEWRSVAVGFVASRDRATRASLMVRLGFCLGRVKGSLRRRVVYL